MRAAIYYGPRDVRMEERPTPTAGPADAVVKIARAGICGTDLTAYLYSGDPVAIFEGGEFGHEMVGTVCEVGADVADVQVGDRVFVCPTTCKRGGMGLADSAGGFSEYVLVEDAKLDHNLYKLDDGVSFDEAVVAEPFAVGTRGKNVAGVRPGDHAVVFGAGPIGLAALSSLVGEVVRHARGHLGGAAGQVVEHLLDVVMAVAARAQDDGLARHDGRQVQLHGLLVHRHHRKPRALLGHAQEVARARDGEARLDDVDVQTKKLTRDHQFLLGVHGSARRLLAVAQRGVEDVDLARHVRASFPSKAAARCAGGATGDRRHAN